MRKIGKEGGGAKRGGGMEESVRLEEGKADVRWNINYDSHCLIKMIVQRITVKMETK